MKLHCRELHSDDKGKLISFVCAGISGRSPINDVITYDVFELNF
jgi:hypothetical protein